MKRIHALTILVAAGLATVLLTVTVYESGASIQRIPMDVQIADVVGFNLNTDAIHFGKVPPGQDAIKTVTLTNLKPYPRTADIVATGQLGAWVTTDEPRVTIPEHSNRSINLTLHAPQDSSFGVYTGTLNVEWRP
jgi:hypothetical protein